MSAYHILPVNDLAKHLESSTCECNPKIEYINGNMIIIHNSFDGREFVERLTELKDECRN